MTYPLESGQHPLTDKMCEQLVPFPLESQHDYQEMRAAADLQLEADAEWWRIILNKAEFLPPHAVDYIVEEFKQAMRPQENG